MNARLSTRSVEAIKALLHSSDPLDTVRTIRAVVRSLDADPALLVAVRDALDNGADWHLIADAAGLTPAAAKWRWQGTDAEIFQRHEAGRKRATRTSSKPTDLPGMSVAEAAQTLGVSVQAIYLRVKRGQLRAETTTLDDGRSFKRVFVE